MYKSKVLILIITITSTYAQYDTDVSLGDDDPELDPAETADLGCPNMNSLRNITFKEILGQWHVPYMSNHLVHHMAKSMNGKFRKHSSMGRMCIKVNVKELPDGGVPNNPGATIWLQAKCSSTASQWSLDCAPSETLNSKWYCTGRPQTHDGDSYVNVVDTDGKTWALVVRCVLNDGMTWAIMSKVKKLDSSLVKSLLRQVEAMGFKLFNVVEVPYEKCMTKPQ